MIRCVECGTPIGILSTICGACAQAAALRKQQAEAGISIWASQGIRELEEHLAAYAAFRWWELAHCHPPV